MSNLDENPTIQMVEAVSNEITSDDSSSESEGSPSPDNLLGREIRLRGLSAKDNLSDIKYGPNVLAENSSLFRPHIVSIGPVFRELTDLQLSEEAKCFFLFESVCKSTIQSREWVKYIRNNENEARLYYANNAKDLSSDELVKILLLDSCFIIQLLLGSNELYNGVIDTVLKTYFLDWILVENQVPFSLLNRVWERHFENSKDPKFPNLISLFKTSRLFYKKGLSPDDLVQEDVIDLTDLYYKWNVPILERISKCQRPQSWIRYCMGQKLHRLQQFWSWFRSFVGRPQQDAKGEAEGALMQAESSLIPSAVELYETGIKFKEKTMFRNMFDVNFKNGVLQIPTLTIDLQMMSLIANLLLHEINEEPVDKIVASFVFLMDSLINTKKDIALLQKCGVINNKLDSEAEAAKFFNSLGARCGVDNMEGNFYAPDIMDMLDYSQSSWRRHSTSLMHNYCNSPWTFLSVVAAIILLFLSGVATWFTVFPRK
ncbi:hypothetical protein LUZ60_007225 [Juncus effusus]|nr:hypothetical protein LUZ60_007225 [Juncus effusus]